MKIEILYKEVCNLYGDYYNHIYLEKCFKNATIYETTLNETPHFIEEDIDLIYLGSSSEKQQELIINKLLPYKNRLKELIDKNKKINILSYQETTKTYNEEEILDIISSNEDVDSFVHCYDSLIALNIYFNNKNCDDGLKIADNYVKNSSIQEINMDINFDEVLTNLINELMSVVKSLEKYTNRKIVRIK